MVRTRENKLIKTYYGDKKKYCVVVDDVKERAEYYNFWTLDQCEMFISRIAYNDDIVKIEIYEVEEGNL